MEKILVRAPNWLGDAVMSTPFLKRLRETRPDAALDVLCPPGLAEIFEGFPGVRSIIRMEGGLPALARRLKAARYDTGYILPPSFSSALLFFLAGIPERIGYAADFRRFFLNRALPLDERYHYVRRYLGLLGEAGREAGAEDLFFPVPQAEERRAKPFLAALGVEWRPPFLAVAPGSRAPARRWFPGRFAELINGLAETEWPTVLLLGAPGDMPFARDVAERCRRPVVNLCGRTPLTALGDILRHCGALVANESGLMHVAWAVGTPTVALAGPSEPRLTSPFGAKVRILQHREVPCVPCVKNECYRAGEGYKECLKQIASGEAREALEELAAAGRRAVRS